MFLTAQASFSDAANNSSFASKEEQSYSDSEDSDLAESFDKKLKIRKSLKESTTSPKQKIAALASSSSKKKQSSKGGRLSIESIADSSTMDVFGMNDVSEPATPKEAPKFLIIKTIDEAKAMCDFWFDVDLDRPETTCPHFTVTHIPKQTLDKESIEIVKVTMKHLTDVRDYPLLRCWCVCKGKAIVIQTPSVPRWMLEPEIHCDEELQFHLGSSRLEDAHKTKFNDIARDADRLIQTTLLVFPDGYKMTAQLKFPAVIDGESVPAKPHELVLSLKTGESKARDHALRPISWLVRNAAKPREYLELDVPVDPEDPFEEDKVAGMPFK